MCLSKTEIDTIMGIASDMKQNPDKYKDSLSQKTLLMLFEKPSLRTRVSFETGMTQLGGHAIFYSIADSPLGKKESLSDTGKVLSRYADFIMARVNKRQDIQELAEVSSIPVINALDNYAHPCQMLADLQTIIEQKSSAEGLKLAFFGDVANNVTYDLMRLGSIVGMKVAVCGPVDKGSEYAVEESVIEECKALGGDVIITTSVEEAATGADIVYCDSWMSYGIPDSEAEQRKAVFMPYQVDDKVMEMTNSDSIFMNCLPAARGLEQTASVIDGPKSVVFDQAENRMHAQKALLHVLYHGF
eukprot:CAMPEP_0185281128 /NCGR_PEP_ID=MMETSP1359-20130426/66546_1 /TAXON_ID=552665 /ORGANISM="Bigelowiella longifila, Strain CCMP242" /LENGTH=300 /DNA_ID=CAMNT_0027876525 /DNA_START=55 /DNA_END=957 /DNA_ORIENTATION=+